MAEIKFEYRKTDLATGETQRWTGTPRERGKPNSKEPFVMLAQSTCSDIATDYDLQGFDLRVLIYLLGRLDTENWVDIHHSQLAAQLSTESHRVARPMVSKALKRLVDAGVLLRGEFRTYRLSPAVGWKGDAAAQQRAIVDHSRGRLTVVRP